ncbi:hypothetical protein HZY83_05535 [Gemella sp. GH3]|nr:hypothetical protein [Gemella sp. GH3.1]NYS51084.1 hypothetical protein [Gemella sp. GH3]
MYLAEKDNGLYTSKTISKIAIIVWILLIILYDKLNVFFVPITYKTKNPTVAIIITQTNSIIFKGIKGLASGV